MTGPRTVIPLPLYHGTRRPFTRGGLVLPGDVVGVDNHGLGRSDRVYVTYDLDLAWDYAEAAKGKGTPKVCEVSPLGPVAYDVSTVGGCEQESFVCDAATVIRVIR